MFHVIYLTGAPATGKSTLLAALQGALSPIETFCYSKILAEFIANRGGGSLSEEGIRKLSANVVTRDDVDAVDTLLIKNVSQWRSRAHVIIDSHPVTKEAYGFRVTPFSLDQLARVSPTLIFNLYTDPEVVTRRIAAHPQGRPNVTEYEAGYHNGLQGAVAITYGIQMGIPVYFLDSAQPTPSLLEQIMKRLN